jgi:hypothetical protein
MLVRFNYFRASLKNYAVRSYCLTSLRFCRISLSHILYKNSLLDFVRKYTAVLRNFLWATPPSELRTVASIQSNACWLFGLCGLTQRASCQRLSPPRSGSLNLLSSVLSASYWCNSKKIDTKTIFLFEPRLR